MMNSATRAQVAKALTAAAEILADSSTLVDDPDELEEEELPHGYFNSVGRATDLVMDIIRYYNKTIPHEDLPKLKEAYRTLRTALRNANKLLD